jgi:isopenicillin N synthase-like dioxygenase
MTETADIAVVSFDRFISGNDADKHAVAKQIYNAFSTVGWVYLKDYGITQARINEIFGLVRIPLPTPSDATDAWSG